MSAPGQHPDATPLVARARRVLAGTQTGRYTKQMMARDILNLAAERDALLTVAHTLEQVGQFAASHSGEQGQPTLLAALYRIADEAELTLARLELDREDARKVGT